jgi:transcriptional regulator of acetoin/glycerol metabolism
MNADQIRKELSGLAQVRAGLEADLDQARDDSASLLLNARKAGVNMSEAAELLGLSRVSAYELLKRK